MENYQVTAYKGRKKVGVSKRSFKTEKTADIYAKTQLRKHPTYTRMVIRGTFSAVKKRKGK